MSKFRKAHTSMWADKKFRDLTPLAPSGQALWMWLLIGPRTCNIPGIVLGTDEVLAAELRWPVEAFREAFREAFAKGMAKGDRSGLIWLPNGVKYNRPESPNVVRSWRSTWEDVPECALKVEAWHALKAFAEGLGEGFAKAFREGCAQPSPNQEQEQEQEQDKKEPKPSASPAASGQPDSTPGQLALGDCPEPVSAPAPRRPRPAKDPVLDAARLEAKAAISARYAEQTGASHPWTAKENTQLGRVMGLAEHNAQEVSSRYERIWGPAWAWKQRAMTVGDLLAHWAELVEVAAKTGGVTVGQYRHTGNESYASGEVDL